MSRVNGIPNIVIP